MILSKKKGRVFFAFLLIFGFIELGTPQKNSSSPSPALPQRGVIIAVDDGDSIKVRFKNGAERKVRLLGIDAPEINDSKEENRFWAQMAKRFVSFYLYRREVRLSYEAEIEDKYGRVLAYIQDKEHGLFNEFMIREGFAFVFSNSSIKKEYMRRFRKAEDEAKKKGNGLWRKGEFRSIPASEARHYLGKVLSVQFFSSKVEERRNFLFLHSLQGEFQALIPRQNLALFPDRESFQNKVLSVTGFLEEYRGLPQIIIFFPDQIRILEPIVKKYFLF